MIKVSVEAKGNFNNMKGFLKRVRENNILKKLDKYGELGVEALAKATPRQTGELAESWYYTIEQIGDASYSITWNNKKVVSSSNGNYSVNIAVILDTGHGTGWGGYVSGRHYISPAIQPIFDKIADDAWKEVHAL